MQHFNPKIKMFVRGRADTYSYLKQIKTKVIWVHTASLGEYELALPVIQKLKELYPSYDILSTFFSPSGYNVCKDNSICDWVSYLPMDTPSNARKFVDAVNPVLAVIVKNEIWPNYMSTLKHSKIKSILISGKFKSEQIHFRKYGTISRKTLQSFTHICVTQNKSIKLLKNINCQSISFTGNSGFDRNIEILDRDNTLDFVETFKGNKLCITLGSSYPVDESLWLPYINKHKGIKYIIVPHEIDLKYLQQLKQKIQQQTLLYSEIEPHHNLYDFGVLIIDTVGILNKIYSYTDIAYVGGGMKENGLHNILEPAIFGVPICIGPVYSKFEEAIDLISEGGVKSVKNTKMLEEIVTPWIEDEKLRTQIGAINKQYVLRHQGATQRILDEIGRILKIIYKAM